MIYTLTTNPAIDMNINTKTLKPSHVNRTDEVVYTPNGKGINVSFVLRHYGIESKILGFFGGFSGHYIVDEIRKRDYVIEPVWIDDEITRINIFINSNGEEYKLVNKGGNVNSEKQQELLDMIKSKDDCTHLSISGSLPAGIDESYYHEILKICKEKGIEIILDISSKELKELLKYEPLLIKPNDDEIKEVFGMEITDENSVKEVMKHLHGLGAKNVLMTMGAKGLYFSNKEKIWFCDAPKITLLSSACSGDSCLAALLSEWLMGKDIEYALKKASATGANVAESMAIGDLKKVDKYIESLNIKEVK